MVRISRVRRMAVSVSISVRHPKSPGIPWSLPETGVNLLAPKA